MIASTLVGATILLQSKVTQTEQKYQRQFQELRDADSKKTIEYKQRLEDSSKLIEELKVQLQSKLDAKARLAAQQAAQAAAVTKVASQAVPHAEAAPVASNASNYDLVTKWANHYGVDPARLHRVVKCESGYQSNAVNGKYWSGGSTPSGISQFLASTYIANAKRIGLPAQDDRMNPDRSLQVMAWMFSIGQWVQWECR